jgi:hypothetical protein
MLYMKFINKITSLVVRLGGTKMMGGYDSMRGKQEGD